MWEVRVPLFPAFTEVRVGDIQQDVTDLLLTVLSLCHTSLEISACHYKFSGTCRLFLPVFNEPLTQFF